MSTIYVGLEKQQEQVLLSEYLDTVMATKSLLPCLQNLRELPAREFRAPPPSPVTGVITSSSSESPDYSNGGDYEDDEISRFLRRSARVPELRLPDRAFFRQKVVAQAPPVIDLRLLALPDSGGLLRELVRSAAAASGCFQVVGHGVDGASVVMAFIAAVHQQTSPALEEMETAKEVVEDGEELWWSVGEGNQELAGNWQWQDGFNHFRDSVEDMCIQLEQIATKLLDGLHECCAHAIVSSTRSDRSGSLLSIRKHRRNDAGGNTESISHDDVLRLLIRNSRCSRALSIHLCAGASMFLVCSRRGWSRFHPAPNAIVVTIGDQVQAWSGGLYKSVSGKPVYHNNDDDLQDRCFYDDFISMEFLYSCSSVCTTDLPRNAGSEKIIRLSLQVLVAAGLLVLYHFFVSCLYAI